MFLADDDDDDDDDASLLFLFCFEKMKLVEKTKKIINNRPPYKQYKCDYLYIGKNHSNLIVYFIK